MKSKILGFDMDGVIVDNCPLKVRIAKDLGYKITLTDAPSEIISKILKPEDVRKLQLALYHNLETSLDAELMPGIVTLLNKIQESQTPFFLISRRLEPNIAV